MSTKIRIVCSKYELLDEVLKYITGNLQKSNKMTKT